MAQQITYDKAYDAVAPEDFPAMLEVPRYGRRSDAFDSIISATHDHFWDPLDKNYIDFDQPFDMANTPIMPLETIVELRCERGRRPAGRRGRRSSSPTTSRTGRSPTCCMASRARCRCRPASATCCSIPGAQEYAANQAREEARHVAGFTRYIARRWGAAAAGRQDHRHGAGRPREHARGLQEDRRHADAGRGPRDGRLRDASTPRPTIPCCAGWCSW